MKTSKAAMIGEILKAEHGIICIVQKESDSKPEMDGGIMVQADCHIHNYHKQLALVDIIVLFSQMCKHSDYENVELAIEEVQRLSKTNPNEFADVAALFDKSKGA